MRPIGRFERIATRVYFGFALTMLVASAFTVLFTTILLVIWAVEWIVR